MRGKLILLAILLAGLVSAVIIESGDAGERFAAEKAEEMCSEPGVESVHICLGNAVRVVWSDESKGVTFYEPEGTIVNCPPVAPTHMGAECIQLMHPNYCPLESVCGEYEKIEFPGGVEGEIIYDGVPVEEEEEEVLTTPEEVRQEPAKRDDGEVVVPFSGPATTTAGTEGEAYDWLVILVVVLALVAVVLLYLAFRRTSMH